MERKLEPRATREKAAKDKVLPKKGETAMDRLTREVPARAPIPTPIPKPQPIKKVAENGSREVKRSRGSQEPVVVDMRRPAFDASKDDAIMKDVRPTRSAETLAPQQKPEPQGSQEPSKFNQNTAQNGDRKSAGIRKSEVSNIVQPMEVLNQVLNTRINLAIGQVLG